MNDPAEGERPALLLRLLPSNSSPDQLQIAAAQAVRQRATSSSSVSSTSTDPSFHPATTFVDHVFTAEVAWSQGQCASFLMPYARSPLSGLDCTCVHFATPTASQPFFFHPVGSVAMALMDGIVSECQKLGHRAYMSFAAVHSRGGGVPDVVDLLVPAESSHGALPSLPMAAALHGSELFPTQNEVSVTNFVRKPSDVCRSALDELKRRQQTAQLPLNCDIVAQLIVQKSNSLASRTRLTIIEIGSHTRLKQSLKLATARSAMPIICGPYGPDPLAMMLFRVGMRGRCVAVGSLGMIDRVHDVPPFLKLIKQFQSVVTAPQLLPVPPRGLLPSVADDERDYALWGLQCEVVRLRQALNDKADAAAATEESAQQADHSQQQWAIAAAPTTAPPSNLLPSAPTVPVVGWTAGSHSFQLLALRDKYLREMEAELQDRAASLERQRSRLLAIPVTEQSLSSASHTALLEQTVEVLKAENARQRSLFSRDIRLLQLEYTAMKEASDRQGSSSLSLSSRSGEEELRHVLNAFAEDVQRCYRIYQSGGTTLEEAVRRAKAAVGLVATQLTEAIDDWCVEEEGNTNPTTNNSTSLRMQTPLPIGKSSSVDEGWRMYVAAVESACLQLGMPSLPTLLEQSKESEHRNPERLLVETWKTAVAERAASRSEMLRLRHAASALQLSASRATATLRRLRTELEMLPAASGQAPNVDATRLWRKRSDPLSADQRVALMIQSESNQLSSFSVNERATKEPVMGAELTLLIEESEAVHEVLAMIAQGLAEPPVGEVGFPPSLLSPPIAGQQDASSDGGVLLFPTGGGSHLHHPSSTSNHRTVGWLESHEDETEGGMHTQEKDIVVRHIRLEELLREGGETSAEMKLRVPNVQQGHFSNPRLVRKKTSTAVHK